MSGLRALIDPRLAGHLGIENRFIHRCTILRATSSTPRPGYDSDTFSLYLSDVRCFAYPTLGQAGVSERTTTDRVVTVASWQVVVPFETDVTDDDRIGAITKASDGSVVLGDVDDDEAGIEIVDVVPLQLYKLLTLRKVD